MTTEEKLVKRTRVTLRESKTYTFGGRKFIKDVPVTIVGEAGEQYKKNAYFKCSTLEPKLKKVKKSKKIKSKNSGSKKKSSSKKTTKKKASKKTLKKA